MTRKIHPPMNTTTSSAIQIGDTVRCIADSIDAKVGNGAIGRVTGFARFSAYHGREACVVFGEGPAGSGWFWVCDLEPVPAA